MDHKLNCPWTFYYFDESEKVSYEEAIHRIAKVSTVEEFWHYYSHIQKPDKIKQDISLHFFRNDCRAMWEDDDYQNGGCFYLTFEKGVQIDFIWERILLGLIGEQFPEDLVGVVIKSKPNNAIVINAWHRTSSDTQLKIEICRQFEQILKLPPWTTIQYKYLFAKLKGQNHTYHLDPNEGWKETTKKPYK